MSERPITIDELVAAAGDGTLKEVWATGTAAVISPVGELAQKLYDTIVGIQYGTAPDPHGWTMLV